MQYKKYIEQFRLRITGKEKHASNSSYNIQKEVHNLILSGEALTGKVLLKTDNKVQEELLELVCAAANNSNAGNFPEPSEVNKLQDFINDNMQYMTTEFLDRIEQVSMMSGMLVLAYAVREKNEELVLSSARDEKFLSRKNSSVYYATKLFWCYINRGDDDAARSLLDHKAIRGNSYARQHVRGLCIALGLSKKDSEAEKLNPVNAEFADYVNNKSIAVMGPSSSETDYVQEIKEDFDIVIRSAYRGAEYLSENQQCLVPQISYYGAIDWDKFFIVNGAKNKQIENLKFAVLSRGEKERYLKDLGYTNIRVASHLRNNFFFHGKHNMIQTILHDLLLFSPARIKVFNTNLFLAKNRYDKGYVPQGDEQLDLVFRRVIVKHNIISQYDFTRQLYKRGLFEADARLSEVLELGTREYMKQMEDLKL